MWMNNLRIPDNLNELKEIKEFWGMDFMQTVDMNYNY